MALLEESRVILSNGVANIYPESNHIYLNIELWSNSVAATFSKKYNNHHILNKVQHPDVVKVSHNFKFPFHSRTLGCSQRL